MTATPDGITFIHSFLVKPTHNDTDNLPIGTIVPLKGDLFELLKIIFEKSDTECKIEIVFSPSEDGSQQNDVRDLLIHFLSQSDDGSRHEDILKLALRLLESTNRVTGPGLLFVIGGFDKGQSKIMVSRFPADEGIMADDQDGKLTVEFVDKLFMKDRNSYKAVVFHKLSGSSKTRGGKAVDKQVNDIRNPSSQYWIEDFLSCQLSVTSQAGSERFASALRKVYNETKDLGTKELLAAAARTIQNFDGEKHTPTELLMKLNVPQHIVSAVQKHIGLHAMAETFQLNSSYFKSSFRFQSKLISNGVMITAEVDEFDKVVEQKTVGEETEFKTKGKVINSKVQLNRAGGAM